MDIRNVGDPIRRERNALRIAHCQTEVDETGQSYYGGSRLAFMCLGGNLWHFFQEVVGIGVKLPKFFVLNKNQKDVLCNETWLCYCWSGLGIGMDRVYL